MATEVFIEGFGEAPRHILTQKLDVTTGMFVRLEAELAWKFTLPRREKCDTFV